MDIFFVLFFIITYLCQTQLLNSINLEIITDLGFLRLVYDVTSIHHITVKSQNLQRDLK